MLGVLIVGGDAQRLLVGLDGRLPLLGVEVGVA